MMCANVKVVASRCAKSIAIREERMRGNLVQAHDMKPKRVVNSLSTAVRPLLNL